jgi:hypothetical protein
MLVTLKGISVIYFALLTIKHNLIRVANITMTSRFSICRVLDDRWIGLFGDKNRNVRIPKTYL